jgi:hypothetical protein
MFYKIAGAGESTTVTMASASANYGMAIAEYSNIDTTSPLIIENSKMNASTNIHTTPTVANSVSDILVVCAVAARGTDAEFSEESVNSSTTGVIKRQNPHLANAKLTFFDKHDSSPITTYNGSAKDATHSFAGGGAIALFRVKSPLLNKVSGTDSGFANTVTPADTDPFNSGEKADYDVQAGDELDADTTYYWRVRGLDPSGSNTYGDWSETRSFTTESDGGLELNLDERLVAIDGVIVVSIYSRLLSEVLSIKAGFFFLSLNVSKKVLIIRLTFFLSSPISP